MATSKKRTDTRKTTTKRKSTSSRTTKADLEAKIAQLEKRLSSLAESAESKPAPKEAPKSAPKPTEAKKPEGGGGPHAHDKKPAEKAPPKPAEKAPSVPLHERFREIPTGNWNTQKVAITGFTAPSNRYFGSRALVAQTTVTPSNWNDQKSKVTGYTAPSNKYFATRQRLAYHPEAKKFGTWINDAPAGEQVKSAPPPPPPPQPEPQASAGSVSDGKSKQEQLEDYEKEYLARLEQKKVDDAKAVAEAAKAEAAAATKAQSNRGSMPKGWGPAGAKANTGH